MAKLGTQFQPITNPANTRLLTLIDESTGLRYKINIADFFAVVASDALFTGDLTVSKNVTPQLTFAKPAGADIVLRNDDTEDALRILLGGSTKFTVLQDGNVGIGDLQPTSKLSVVGDATVSGNIDMPSGKFTQTVGFAGGFAMEVINSNNGGSGLRIQGGGTSGVNFIIAGFNQAGVERFNIDDFGAVTFVNLAGTGTRAVMVDANGLLSAP